MLVAGLGTMIFIGLFIFLFVRYVGHIPKPFLKFFGYFLLVVSSLESLLIIWILVYVWNSDWTLWSLSINDFWREELSFIYFIKVWLYSWFWNDLLNFFLALLPAIVFMVVRTTITTALGFLSLAVSRKGSWSIS